MTIVLVVDASVLLTALADDHRAGDTARARLRDDELVAPDLVDLEVVSVLRRLHATGRVDDRRAALALADLRDLPLTRASHRLLVPRCWDLRANLTPYDAAYVALAEALGATLVTADRALAAAPGVECEIEVLEA